MLDNRNHGHAASAPPDTVQKQPGQLPVRLIVLDSQGLFRTSLARLLAGEGSFEIAGECATADEARAILAAAPVDIVLLASEIGLPQTAGLLAAARDSGLPTRFLIVSATADAARASALLGLGVAGIFLKSGPAATLIEALTRIASGGVWVDPRIVRQIAEESPRPNAP
ncbi:MAG: response regulator transcription factor [Acidobacteriota bacterium]|nr:response regulator transcription factor [Acidobacteriota bacterium]